MSLKNSKGLTSLAAGLSAIFVSASAVYAAPVYTVTTSGTASSPANLGAVKTAHDTFISSVTSPATVVHTFTFESYTQKTDVTSGLSTPDFNLTFTGPNNKDTVYVAPIPSPVAPKTGGFNTTAGGSNFLFVEQAIGKPTSLTFTFAKPTTAFGFYYTGLGNTNGHLDVSFNDGSTETTRVNGTATGGAGYFSLSDLGKTFTSITFTEPAITNNNDRFSIDDITTVSLAPPPPPPAVPEPAQTATLLMGVMGLLGIGAVRKNRRQSVIG